MNKIIVQIIYVVISGVISYIAFDDSNWKFAFIGISLGLIFSILNDLSFIVIKNWNRTVLLWQTKVRYRRKRIRVSMSYIYRIKVKDQYLLVENSDKTCYQPVGGKYKRQNNTHNVLSKFNFTEDEKLQTHGKNKGDLTINLPARNVLPFIDWFNKKQDREISQWREFYEELVATEILSFENFGTIDYEHVVTFRSKLNAPSSWGGVLGIWHYEVYDLLPTPEQELELESLLEKGDTDYIKWADESIIQKLGYNEQTRTIPYIIGAHAKWAVNKKWERETKT